MYLFPYGPLKKPTKFPGDLRKPTNISWPLQILLATKIPPSQYFKRQTQRADSNSESDCLICDTFHPKIHKFIFFKVNDEIWLNQNLGSDSVSNFSLQTISKQLKIRPSHFFLDIWIPWCPLISVRTMPFCANPL